MNTIDLALPKFLDRRDGVTVWTARRRTRRAAPPKIKLQKLRDGFARYEIKSTNECDSIGCGQRIVIATIGRKWVRLKNEYDKQFSRIGIAAWNKIVLREIK
jgi:hypothetical protein